MVKPEVETREPANVPTTLNLFEYPSLQQDNLRMRYTAVRNFQGEIKTSSEAMTRLYKTSDEKIDRLKLLTSDLRDQQLFAVSSRNCGALYLLLQKDLSQGTNPPSDLEIFDFFKLCTRVLTQHYSYYWNTRDPGKKSSFSHRANTHEGNHRLKQTIDQNSKTKPQWFHGNRSEWFNFIFNNTNLVRYINDDQSKFLQTKFSSFESDTDWETMIPEALPEWLTDNQGNVPILGEVEKEFQEDAKDERDLEKQCDLMINQIEYIYDITKKKWIKTTQRSIKKRRELFPRIVSFPDIIMYISTWKLGPYIYDTDPELLETMSDSEIKQVEIPSEKDRTQKIEEFVAKYSLSNPEILALWIETQLRESKLIKDAKVPFESQTSKAFSDALSDSAKLDQLKDTNKRGYNAMKYEIEPLFTLLSLDERTYIQDLLGLPDQTPDAVIREIGVIVAQKLVGEKKEDYSLNNVRNRIKKFAEKWIRNNWQWAASELQNSINKSNSPVEEKPESDLQTLEREIQEEIKELQHDNLMGWRIHYLQDPDREKEIEEDELVEIKGATVKEKEEQFKDYVGKNKIPCRKPASVIQALERLVDQVDTVEDWTRKKKTVRGIPFDKHKIDDVRILYRVYQEAKRIIFATHQKKDWGYGF